MKFKEMLSSATMGDTRRLRPMIIWTIIEYFFRGAPYGITLYIIWQLFEPLQNPEVQLNTTAVILSMAGLLISLIILAVVTKKSYIAAYKDGYDICCDGRKEIVSHLRKLPMGFYNSKDPGDIGAYIVSDYNNIEQLVTHFIPQIIGSLTMPVVLILFLSFFNLELALAAALVIPLAWPAVLLSGWLVRRLGKNHQQSKVESASRMLEYIQGIRLVKAFNLEGERFERLEKAFRTLKTESIRLEGGSGPIVVFSSAILNAGFVLIMLLGFSFLLSVKISLPVYVMFLILGIHIYQPLMNGLIFFGIMNYMTLGVTRIEDLRKTPILPDGDNTKDFENFIIRFENVSFSYNNATVIDNLTVSIPEKKLTALVGPSGSGKTTVTRLISRFWDIESGSISIGGANIKDYPTDHLISNISIVFQDVYLFNDTIYNNIRIGKEDASKEEIIAAARMACCHDFIEAFPNGYETMVGEGGSTLSGGEKQRISIARAILKNSPIVLLDEATASLDPENELHIQQAINELVKDKTVIVIAHRLNTIRKADNIIILDKGRLSEQGNHEELIAKKGLYFNLWEEQLRVKGWKF